LNYNKFFRNAAIQGSALAFFGDIAFSDQNCEFKDNIASFGGEIFTKPEQLKLKVYQINEAFLYVKDVSIRTMILSPETVESSTIIN